MLKVTVNNEKVVDDRWGRGTIRTSKCRNTVILVTYSSDAGKLVAVVLKENGYSTPYISGLDKYDWINLCPIVVENAELIIGGGNND